MLELLLFVTVFAPAPLLAIVVFAVRLRAVRRGGVGALVARARAAVRAGTGRPVWPGLVAVAACSAVLTAVLEQAYLATVTESSRWGVDVTLLSVVLGLLAVVVCAALAGLAAAVVSRVRGFGAGTVAGLLARAAVAVGTASAHLPLRVAYLAEPARFPVVTDLGDRDLLLPFEIFLGALIWAVPWPVLGAGVTRSRNAVRDIWQLLLDLATADLLDDRSEWSVALRAELAAIEPWADRRRFALGGAWAALRSARSHRGWVPAAGTAVVVAAGIFAASRWSLAHDRGGVLGYWVGVPSAVLLVVALTTAWQTRSFGSGLRVGVMAGLAAMVAVLGVSVPEAVLWANRQAGYLSTGDAVPPTWQAAVGDVVRPEFLGVMIVFWTVGAAAGAALGAAPARLHTPRDPFAAAPAGP